MRKVFVFYKDPMDHYRDEYRAGPYTGDKVESVKYNLQLMGCEQFRVEPFKEAA